ncbi:hypothetical protein [Xylanibacter brevis]|uniref:hypothetical protein n=1 Tax=Xylanibacter brevis TaxID=83231 RepID=UPI0012DBF817|nr:hypothetical protein [Xylanibacter brevis]
MIQKVLRFFGAVIAAFLFSHLVDSFHIVFFGGAAHFFFKSFLEQLVEFRFV